jgi:sugar phosphate permease
MEKAAGGRSPVYRGWFVLLGAFLAAMFAGIIHTSFGFFVVPATEDLGISRADANTWLIIMSVGTACLGPFVGRLIDRVSVRLIMGIGAVVLFLSLSTIGASHSPLVIAALAIPIAFAADGAGSMAAGVVTARWFRRRRGRALALVGIATSAAGFFLAPIVSYLVANYGWRAALPMIGALSAMVILTMVAFVIRSKPEPDELRAAGEEKSDITEEAAKAEARLWTYRELLTSRNFLLLAFGAGLLFACDRALLITIAPYMSDIGMSVQTAALLVSTIMGSSIAGKLIVGYLADRIDARKIFLVVAGLHIVLLIMFLVQPGVWVMFGIAVVAGLGVGGVQPTKQVLTATTFGSASFGTVVGTAAVVHQVLMMMTFRFVGEVHDRTGSYDLAFLTFMAFVVIGAILIWKLKLPGQSAADPEHRSSLATS